MQWKKRWIKPWRDSGLKNVQAWNWVLGEKIKQRRNIHITLDVSTSRKVKGWGRHYFHQMEPNWPMLYSTMPVPPLRDARLGCWVIYCSICASTMPRAQNGAGKGSILLWRPFTFPIFLLFIYEMVVLTSKEASDLPIFAWKKCLFFLLWSICLFASSGKSQAYMWKIENMGNLFRFRSKMSLALFTFTIRKTKFFTTNTLINNHTSTVYSIYHFSSANLLFSTTFRTQVIFLSWYLPYLD